MAALWGSRGRPETNQYAQLCEERAEARDNPVWKTVSHPTPPPAIVEETFHERVRRLGEHPYTSEKRANGGGVE